MEIKREIIDAVIISKANSKTGRQDNPVTELNEGITLKELELDSLDVMEIIMECEKLFGVKIRNEKIVNIFTKEDIYNLFEA